MQDVRVNSALAEGRSFLFHLRPTRFLLHEKVALRYLHLLTILAIFLLLLCRHMTKMTTVNAKDKTHDPTERRTIIHAASPAFSCNFLLSVEQNAIKYYYLSLH